MHRAGIIQVRMDSSRFPSKSIQPIENKPLLWHVIKRSKLIGIPIIVATTKRQIDDPIEKISQICEVDCFRGSYEDVLDRYYQAAKKYSIKKIFRITADCPLIDPRLCKKLVSVLEQNNVDYARFMNYPIGVGMEGCTFEALENAWINAKQTDEREHVTLYFKVHANQFKIVEIKSKEDLSRFYWAVEEPKDLEFVRDVFAALNKKKVFFTEDILKFIKVNPKNRSN